MAISFVAGSNPVLMVNLIDQNGNPINLTGYTAKIWFQISGGTPVSGAMTIVDATSGQVKYQFTSNQLILGIMIFQINIYDSSGNFYATYSQAGSSITITPSLGP